MKLIDTRPEYPPEWDDAESRDDAINDKRNELLEGECDPFTPFNVAEYIYNLDDESEELKLIVQLVRSNKSLNDSCVEYWTEQADKIATDYVDNP